MERPFAIRVRKIKYASDLDWIAHLEASAFDDPWTLDELESVLAMDGTDAIVAVLGKRVIGYAVFAKTAIEIRVMSFSVDFNYRRRGIGKKLFANLKAKSRSSKRPISCVVNEYNDEAHLFLRAIHIPAMMTLRKYYRDSSAAAYFFCTEPGKVADCNPIVLTPKE